VGDRILNLKNIQKSFDNKVIHSGVDLCLEKGETLGLLGASGTGKSVLLRSIIGLNTIDDGEIYFHNNRIDLLLEKELYSIRTKISYSFQSGALFDSLDVFCNLAYPLYEHTTMTQNEITFRVQDVLKQIDMEDTEKLMPSDLSGGMQKRIGMARAMILEPEIILYDEPTAGLDPSNTKNVLQIMESLKEKGISSIFVTHDIPSAVQICDRILILHEGKIGVEATPSELCNTDDPIVRQFFTAEAFNQEDLKK